MSQVDDLQALIALAQKMLVDIKGDPLPTGFDVNDKRTWWPAMQAQAANNTKPHDWVDLGPGHVTDSGDNDAPDDDLLRVFGPFMHAALFADNPQQHDSTGARWSLQTIKKRAGIGPKSWEAVRNEIRSLWFTQWAVDWRNDPLNATQVPKQSDVDRIFAKVY